jgi:uncharacterized protein (TIGR03437 family)
VLLNSAVKVTIGGVELDPAFAGLAPGTVGLFQVNVQVPEGTLIGPAIPVSIRVTESNGIAIDSNLVKIAVGSTSAQ